MTAVLHLEATNRAARIIILAALFAAVLAAVLISLRTGLSHPAASGKVWYNGAALHTLRIGGDRPDVWYNG